MTTHKRVRLLYVLSEFMFGSKVRQLCDLVAELKKDPFDIEVCALEVGNEATPEVEALGVPYYQLRLHPPRRISGQRVAEFLRSPLMLRSKNYDVVHSLCYQSILVEPLIVKLFSRAKFVYTKTNLEWSNHRINWYAKSKLADAIISISRATDELLDKVGFSQKKVRIPLGIDTELFSGQAAVQLRYVNAVPKDAVVFGCVGQFVEWKEHLTLIKAFDLLCERYPNIYLLFCGPDYADGYYRSVLQAVSNSPGRDRINFLGTLKDMPEFYAAIDCFVLPSRYEPFGYVYVEAMSCGKPVIACRAGGPLDIVVDGETGFLVDISSPTNLAANMEKYLRTRGLMAEHGRTGRERVVKLFSKKTMASKHCELYLRLISS